LHVSLSFLSISPHSKHRNSSIELHFNHVSISNNAEAAQAFAEGDAARHAGVAPRSQSLTLSDTSKVSQPCTLCVFPVSIFEHAQLLLARFDAVAGPAAGEHRKRPVPGSRTRSFA
jgi:hypothetical protein